MQQKLFASQAPLPFSFTQFGELRCLYSVIRLLRLLRSFLVMPRGNICHAGGWQLRRELRVQLFHVSIFLVVLFRFACLALCCHTALFLTTVIFTEAGWPTSSVRSRDMTHRKTCSAHITLYDVPNVCVFKL